MLKPAFLVPTGTDPVLVDILQSYAVLNSAARVCQRHEAGVHARASDVQQAQTEGVSPFIAPELGTLMMMLRHGASEHVQCETDGVVITDDCDGIADSRHPLPADAKLPLNDTEDSAGVVDRVPEEECTNAETLVVGVETESEDDGDHMSDMNIELQDVPTGEVGTAYAVDTEASCCNDDKPVIVSENTLDIVDFEQEQPRACRDDSELDALEGFWDAVAIASAPSNLIHSEQQHDCDALGDDRCAADGKGLAPELKPGPDTEMHSEAQPEPEQKQQHELKSTSGSRRSSRSRKTSGAATSKRRK